MTAHRGRLAAARLYLLFSPELCAGEPLDVLAAALPWTDLVQVRIKAGRGPGPARALCDWTARVLERVERERPGVPVLVNDRVDVARTLAGAGCAGVHLGQTDAPPELARELLGDDALVGLSTHSPREVALGIDAPVDYLGFGPIHPTATKGYERGLGAEAAWVAARAAGRPVFPIGGIDATNASELAGIGRAAVSSAVLGASDPAAAARSLRAQLEAGD